MLLQPIKIDAGIEKSAVEAIASQRRLRDALPTVRETLPVSLRLAVEKISETPLEDIFQTQKLDDGQEVLRHLRALLNELGGAPTLHHTEEGEPYWVGGSENGRKVEILIECLDGMLRHARKTSDWISARSVLTSKI